MEHKPLHVLVVASWLPDSRDRLIGIYHKHFCKALADAGMQVNMLYVDRQPISQIAAYPFMKKAFPLQEEGYTVYYRRMLNRSRISQAMQMDAYTRCLERLYRDYEKLHGKPDVIHAQVLIPAGYAASQLGKKIGVPVLITEHASYFESFFSGWSAPYAQQAARDARVTCVGKYMVDILEKYGVHARVLPNIVDCSAYTLPKKPSPDGTLRFATVCGLRKGKRIHNAVDALAKLKAQGALPSFLYTVVGDGEMRQWYENAAAQSNMTDCVRFVGRKNREEIAEILSQTDILLLPSAVETFAIPAVEATAAGVPVVSTRCGGPEGFLTEECAEFCDVGDIDAMAQAILTMVNRLPTLEETKIRAIAAPFDAKQVVNQALSLYRECME